MPSRSRRDLRIGFQNRSATIDGDLLEAEGFATAVHQRRPVSGGMHPRRFPSE